MGEKVKSTISQEQFQQCEVVARESLHALGNVIPELYLNDVQTTVFIMSWCKKSYQEIADVFDTNANNIGVRIMRIKERLKIILDGKIN